MVNQDILSCIQKSKRCIDRENFDDGLKCLIDGLHYTYAKNFLPGTYIIMKNIGDVYMVIYHVTEMIKYLEKAKKYYEKSISLGYNLMNTFPQIHEDSAFHSSFLYLQTKLNSFTTKSVKDIDIITPNLTHIEKSFKTEEDKPKCTTCYKLTKKDDLVLDVDNNYYCIVCYNKFYGLSSSAEYTEEDNSKEVVPWDSLLDTNQLETSGRLKEKEIDTPWEIVEENKSTANTLLVESNKSQDQNHLEKNSNLDTETKTTSASTNPNKTPNFVYGIEFLKTFCADSQEPPSGLLDIPCKEILNLAKKKSVSNSSTTTSDTNTVLFPKNFVPSKESMSTQEMHTWLFSQSK